MRILIITSEIIKNKYSASIRTVKIIQQTNVLLDDSTVYEEMSSKNNPYGDGKTSKRISDIIFKVFE